MFTINRIWADPRFLDPSIDPSTRSAGCYAGDPRTANYSAYRAERLPGTGAVRIVKAYYGAVDSLDAARISNAYLAAPTTTLQFNADDPIVTVDAIREFSARFSRVVSSSEHTMIEIWTTPLLGAVVPVNLPPTRSASTMTVVSTALPTFTVGESPAATRLALPATSIFTIDIESEKFVSVHSMFDIAKIYAAAGS